MDAVCQISELQSSCSPGSPDMHAEPTRWQRLRAVAQTRSLLPSHTAVSSMAHASSDGLYALHVASSPLDHDTIDSCPHQATGTLSRPDQAASARARVLLRSQHVSGVIDSLDADLQVEAVLQRAANRAACLAGLPRAPSRGSTVLAALPLQPHPPAADSKVPMLLPCCPLVSHACRVVNIKALWQQVTMLAGCCQA